ncbi:MAG TPA: glycosyltransferase, partial [Nocardioidaceae bacterium]|nr:glycosyltransferase [Nocardioidaceae bacterium]
MGARGLPEGRYLSCTTFLHPDAGGQTRALLMRNAAFHEEAGICPEILSFMPAGDFPQRRRLLRERGLLHPELTVRNIFDHYREHPWRSLRSTGRGLTDLSRHQVDEELRADGSPWRVSYRDPTARARVHDYLRADGTTYLRTRSYRVGVPRTWHTPLLAVNPDGEVAGSFATPAEWSRHWVGDLLHEDEPAFVFIDARALVLHLAPLREPNVHLLYVMHNMHLQPPRRWDSATVGSYGAILNRAADLDALVTLTERQREDIAQRVGATSNLFVVPNPVHVPEPPPEVTRDPRQVAVVARLEPQKRVRDAVRVFARVVAAVPDARLEVFGTGREEPLLRDVVRRRGLSESVTLRGFDPHARDALWRSSALLLTSAFEGYPLTTLESMSRGCPVVSYDVKYGPREQITDGVDGFLVPDGDLDAAADRVVELLGSPDLVARMSAAAVAEAHRHGIDRFLEDWAHVLHTVVEQKPRRTDLSRLRHRVREYAAQDGQLGGQPGELRVTVTVRGPIRATTALRTARVELALVDETTGEVRDLPAEVQRDWRGLRVTSTCPEPS